MLRRFASRNDKEMLAPSNDKTKLDFFNVEDFCFSGERGFEAVDFEFLKTYKLANDTGTVLTFAFPVLQKAKNYNDFSYFMKLSEKYLKLQFS